jgi:hypothetical protein
MFSPKNKGPIVLITLSIIAIFISGLFFAFSYFIIGSVQTSLEEVNCDLPAVTGYATCQEWFSDTIYNLLNLKGILITFSYIFVFVLVLGMLIVGYNVGGKPIYMGIYFVAVLLLTYGGILLSNLYRTFLDNPIVYEIMQPFTIYNKIMLNFPWFVGIIGLLSVGLSVVNYQRAKVNEPDPTSVLDY